MKVRSGYFLEISDIKMESQSEKIIRKLEKETLSVKIDIEKTKEKIRITTLDLIAPPFWEILKKEVLKRLK